MNSEEFINPQLESYNLDTYYMKKSIFQAVSEANSVLNGKLLDAGCGKMPYKEYILQNSKVESYVGLDIESAIKYDADVKPDFTWDGIKMPFNDNSFDSVIITEVLEHCPDLSIILIEINRVLKPGGVLFFTVPFLWPLHEIPHDEARYTPFHLERSLMSHSFERVLIESTGGWNASMAQMSGLWALRSGKGKFSKKFWSILLKPFVARLIKTDKVSSDFNEGSMNTGFKGLAYKK